MRFRRPQWQYGGHQTRTILLLPTRPNPRSSPSVNTSSNTVIVPNMSFWRVVPEGNWAWFRTVNPGVPPMMLFPLFWTTFDVNPLRPVRKEEVRLNAESATLPPGGYTRNKRFWRHSYTWAATSSLSSQDKRNSCGMKARMGNAYVYCKIKGNAEKREDGVDEMIWVQKFPVLFWCISYSSPRNSCGMKARMGNAYVYCKIKWNAEKREDGVDEMIWVQEFPVLFWCISYSSPVR
ncbi:unnamed protein product [Fraxinus pennsylvanica]|uniref:Uncharacterized protein n=1 Tax=Fraxinus pennsylvanica TaxID=56036 RepID=A0AAD1ZIB6_9LAMI|nr:unnamed protein product [Fraxinus pennsylvanica]